MISEAGQTAVEQAYADCEFCSDCAPDCEQLRLPGPRIAPSWLVAAAVPPHYATPSCGHGGCLAPRTSTWPGPVSRLAGGSLRQPRQ